MKLLASAFVGLLGLGCVTSPEEYMADRLIPTTVTLTTIEGKGFCSGVAVSTTRVLTAAHCYMGNTYVRVEGGERISAALVWMDEAKDLMILEVAPRVLTPAPVGDSSSIRRGQKVYMVGAPYGDLEFSFTVGYIGHPNRSFEREGITGRFFQMYIESRGGNSGGPVFNVYGEIIGILVRSDRSGVSFAVPVNDVPAEFIGS